MILQPGEFKVSEYRTAITTWVKVVAAICAFDPNADYASSTAGIIQWVRSLRYDHRPALQDRPYDTEAGDFVPPQNDPAYIEALPSKEHDHRTFGRKPDAEKVATTLGSDAWNRRHARDVSNTQASHELKMAMKVGDPDAIAKILKVEKRERPKRKIPSRPFRRAA